jgi:ketosteroid isomerase-like protein
MTTNSDVAASITTNNKKLCAELASGNAAGCGAMYAKGARLMPPNVGFTEGADIAGWWQGAIDMGITDITLTSDTVEVHGDTAIEVGNYVLFGPERANIDNGKYLVVWKNEGGTWKLFQDIFNTNVAAA